MHHLCVYIRSPIKQLQESCVYGRDRWVGWWVWWAGWSGWGMGLRGGVYIGG